MRGIVLAAALCVAAAGGARAATISLNVNLGPVDPYEGISQRDQGIPAFDPALGTLTGMTLRARIALGEGVTVAAAGRDTAAPTTGTFPTRAELTLFGGPGLLRLTATPHTITVPLVPFGFFGPLGISNGTVQDTFDDTFAIDPAFLAGLSGGNGAVRYAAFASPFPIDVFFPQDGFHSVSAGGILTVTYAFDPIPEPASLGILACALAVTVGVRRPKRGDGAWRPS